MGERRSSRSVKDVDLQMLDYTPRKSIRTPGKTSLLQDTPDKNESSETERRSSKSVRSRKSRQLEVEHSREMENNNSLLNSSKVINNARFDPQHLYGLDNPDNVSSGKQNESGQETKPELNVAYKTGKKEQLCHFIFFAFSVFVWLVLTGWMLRLNSLIPDKLENTLTGKLPNKELALEIKHLEEKISKLEKGNKLCNAQSYQKAFLDDEAVKGDGQEMVKLASMRIEQALQRWEADKIGIPDYALESAGGQIHSAYHSATFSNGAPQLLLFGIPLWYEVRTPRVVIQPGNTPGECWAFHGKEGYVVIKLSQMIRPSSFTLEHMSSSLSQFGDNSIPSAPKEFSVWGWSDAHGKEKTKLGEYVYDHEGTALQTFPVQVSTESNFRFIELRVHSNYGNPSYTCLYRFRVHGDPYKIAPVTTN